MKNLDLESDEGIIQQTKNVGRYQTDDNYTEIYEMYLTNKNLILVYEESTGLLKTEDVVEKIPLSDIKRIKNKIQVFKVDDDDYGIGMQIIFKDGSCDHFVFEKEKEITPWMDAISETIIEENISNEEDSEPNQKAHQEMLEKNQNYMYCSNCGAQIDIHSNFCNSCGKPVTSQNKAPEEKEKEAKRTTRKTVYEGKVHKCPNCGETIKGFEIKCSACGYELREIDTNNAVNKLAQKLEKAKTIEEKEDLISNFYIPNTKEEIYDFFILASSNIQYNEYGIKAWFSKLEQAYHKAKMTSANSQEFQYIEKIYQKIKRKRLLYSIIDAVKNSRLLQGAIVCVIGGLFVIIGFFKGEASGNSESSYYMMALLGMVIIMGGCAITQMKPVNTKKNIRTTRHTEENDEEKE